MAAAMEKAIGYRWWRFRRFPVPAVVGRLHPVELGETSPPGYHFPI
jgi:hypothetical protein